MSQQAIRILCVDDEASIRRALRPPLLDLGFQLVEASRGEEALQQLRSGSFDIVLLDINMPGIGGLETLRRIRAPTPHRHGHGARRRGGKGGGARVGGG